MDFKAIIIDVDGTLIQSNQKIDDKTHDVLMRAQQQGAKLILASGRPTTGVERFIEELQLDKYHGLIASFNGACITDCHKQEIIYETPIQPELARRFLEHCEAFDVSVMVVKGDTLCVNDAYPEPIMAFGSMTNIVKEEARICKLKVHEVDLKTYVDFPVYKILIAGDSTKLSQVYDELKAPFEDYFTVALSAPFFIEFTDKGVNKAQGIDAVLHQYGIHQSQTIAFGDAHNDLDLLAYAHLGVAMGNAEQAVKDVADVITKSNDDAGIYHILKQYIENK